MLADETNAVASVESPVTSAAASQLTDGEVWNQGVEYWRAGDMTNALATLRPLMLSKTHGARASEVVGAIQQMRMREAAAQDLARCRDSGEEFISMEDLSAACPKVPQNSLETLKRLGALGDLPESSQMSFFDF